MKIACLGWGSLIWKPAELPVASDWFADGPWLPIEFAREGDSGELATVLCDGVAEVQVLWALLSVDDLDAAREALREREGVPSEQPECIGSWPAGPDTAFQGVIGDWARKQQLDAVVWTALPPRSRGLNQRMPTPEAALTYLRTLDPERQAHARDYIRRTPVAIDTAYRRLFQRTFGWRPVAEADLDAERRA
ncbi:hypothetical protein SB11R_05205 [Pseudomonas oryzihabitans]|nr:hypothetical protein SB11R_05205 [Pseudomonas psychrotolerans]